MSKRKVTAATKQRYISDYLEETCPRTKDSILSMIEQGTVRVTVERGVVKLHCSREHRDVLQAVVEAGAPRPRMPRYHF